MDWKSILIAAGSAFIGGLLVVGLVGGNEPAGLGGSTSDDWNVGGNLSVTGTSALTGATTFTDDVTLNGGSRALTLTTSNTATSSAIIGCTQFYATSTASALRVVPAAISTTTTTFGNGTTGFPLVAVFGACP